MGASVKRILPDATDNGPTWPVGSRPDTPAAQSAVWRQACLAAEPAETPQAEVEPTLARDE